MKKAFTLIELLVVIAIIALLLAIVVPSLSLAKRKATAAICLNNTKQLSLAWYLYQGDNKGRIMSAEMENVGINKSAANGWIGMPHTRTDLLSSSLSITQTTPAVTDEDEIRGIERGNLYSYINNSNTYNCPGDKVRKGPDGTRLYVSYCLPFCLYGTVTPSSSPTSLYNLQIKKFDEITSPGSRYNFVESGERNRGNWIVGGHFVMATPEYGDAAYGLWSPLAISHGDSGVFGFCDGHAEVYKWHSEEIFLHYKATENTAPGSSYGKRIPAAPSNDIDFLASGWAYRYKR